AALPAIAAHLAGVRQGLGASRCRGPASRAGDGGTRTDAGYRGECGAGPRRDCRRRCRRPAGAQPGPAAAHHPHHRHRHHRRRRRALAALRAAAETSAGESRMTSLWDKIKAWFKHSLTILWARIVALAGLLLACGQALLADPNVTGAIQTALQPKFIPYYVIAIGLVTELARRRTAGRS